MSGLSSGEDPAGVVRDARPGVSGLSSGEDPAGVVRDARPGVSGLSSGEDPAGVVRNACLDTVTLARHCTYCSPAAFVCVCVCAFCVWSV